MALITWRSLSSKDPAIIKHPETNGFVYVITFAYLETFGTYLAYGTMKTKCLALVISKIEQEVAQLWATSLCVVMLNLFTRVAKEEGDDLCAGTTVDGAEGRCVGAACNALRSRPEYRVVVVRAPCYVM